MFYAPMTFPDNSSQEPDARCFFVYKGAGLRFPHFMTLSAAPASASGIYNHWQFILKLLSVDQRPEAWEISECSYSQSAPKSFCLTAVSQRHGRPGQPPEQTASEEPSSSHGPADIDMSFFDAPHLLQASGLQHPLFSDKVGLNGFVDGNNTDEDEIALGMQEEEEGFISDGLLSDEDKEDKGAEKIVPHGNQDVATDTDNESAKSAGPTASGIKTVATDIQILRDCLGSRRIGLGVVCTFDCVCSWSRAIISLDHDPILQQEPRPDRQCWCLALVCTCAPRFVKGQSFSRYCLGLWRF